MHGRLWAWLIGTLCLFGVLAVAAVLGTLRWPTAVGLGVGWLVGVGLIEAAIRKEPADRPEPARDVRPADGRVGVAALAGVRREPADWDRRFGRLTGLEGDEPGRPRSRPWRQSPELVGRVVVLSVFLGRDGRGWNDRELAEAHRSLERGAAWIEGEARRHGVAVNIDLADTYIVVDDVEASRPAAIEFGLGAEGVEPFERDREVDLIAASSRAVARLGLGVHDLAALIGAIEPRVEADRRAWLLHPRSAGRSWAVSEVELGLPGVNLAVCYARESGFSEILQEKPYADPVSVVHELLHLFGATDKYGVPLRNFSPGSVSRRDVMRLDFNVLGSLRIDPLTASEIGWRNPAAAGPPTKNARRGPG